ncbi:MAG: dihydropteroate synthase [Phycisphaerales bacterium]|nr:dihydropteroate synthase [Phycisphaerales bacterium]
MSFKNTHLPVANMLQSKGNLLDLAQPVVMGIINTTPDSFFEASRKQSRNEIMAQAAQMIQEGAKILDLGAASTRPGASVVPIDEEIERVCTPIQDIKQQFPDVWISIDTYHASVAKAAVESGAAIVNDISGGSFDVQMISTVATLAVPFIAMHLRGDAHTMHQKSTYTNITLDVLNDLQLITVRCKVAGIKDLILDPGFGFSKSISENYELLNQMSQLRALGKPILAGLSRKSMIYKSLNTDAKQALNGTTALNMVALQQGASILRVHDVKAANEAIHLFEMLD